MSTKQTIIEFKGRGLDASGVTTMFKLLFCMVFSVLAFLGTILLIAIVVQYSVFIVGS